MSIALIWMICAMSMMPSSSTAAIVDITWSHGRKMGFLTALGGSAGVIVYIGLATAVSTVLVGAGLWVNVLEGVGAVFLAGLGVIALIEAFTKPQDTESSHDKLRSTQRAVVTGLLTTCLSPKTALFYLVILTQHDFTGMSLSAGILAAGLFHILFRLTWYGIWIHLIEPLRRTLQGNHMQRSMKLITGALMLALSAYALS